MTFDNIFFLWVAFILFELPFIIKFAISFLNVILFRLPEIVKEAILFFIISVELFLSNINS
jgi:hypothetical protein